MNNVFIGIGCIALCLYTMNMFNTTGDKIGHSMHVCTGQVLLQRMDSDAKRFELGSK